MFSNFVTALVHSIPCSLVSKYLQQNRKVEQEVLTDQKMVSIAFLCGEANLVGWANFLSGALSFESEMVPQMRTIL